MRHRSFRYISILLLVIANILCGIIFLRFFLHGQKAGVENLHSLAKDIVDTCKSTRDKATCYDTAVPKLMKTITMEQAFQVTKIIQDLDTTYRYCHVLGHQLSAAEVDKDPSKWKEVISRCPSGVCSNGCIHGGFQERFRKDHFTDEDLKTYLPDLLSICEESKTFHPTGLEQASCYHALGHLTMYITNGEIKKALPLCDKISVKSDGRDFSQLCYDGAFMQIYQPLEPDDFRLVEGKQPTRSSVKAFCDSFASAPRNSCISESWPLYREKMVKDSQEIVKLCSQSPETSRDRCYSAMFYVVTAQLNFDVDRIVAYCGSLSDPLRGSCFANAASRLIETDYRNIDSSVELCKASAKYSDEDASWCFQELTFYAHYNFHEGSAEQKKLCEAMPSPWNKNCLQSTAVLQNRPFTHENK